MGEQADPRDPLEVLVEQFLQRRRGGEALTVESFAAAHPDQAATLRDLLPTLLALEQVKRDKESTGGLRVRVALPAMQRLGDFRIVRELGRGGMGVVFEAQQESLGRRVALKVLPQASLLTGNQLERFRREAQVAAQLHHSNIVPVYGSGESDGYHWYAMQYIEGQSLDQWRGSAAAPAAGDRGAWRLRARFVASVGTQVAAALHYAHGQGTLHRDVKPANLLLEGEQHVWVTDFGLAKALEAEGLTHSGDLLGTLQYMAPEQFAGHYDVRSEVYALGITLYELLSLQPAYAARSRSELMERIRSSRPAGLARACPYLPDDLAVVVERAIARDPADRYADAGALAADLQAFLDDRQIAARRQGALALTVRWCRRNRLLASLLASTAAAVVAAGAVGWASYVVTDGALGRERQAARLAEQESRRADANLALALSAFDGVFDALVGRDPLLVLDEGGDTDQSTVVARTAADPGSLELLRQLLGFYGQFAAQNAEHQALRFETARANRRVGAIHARLGSPQGLQDARAAYDRALQLLEDVRERDVTREIAAVQVDYGQLEHRLGNLPAAGQRFQRAITLLEGEGDGGSRPLRFERAQAHFLLARLADLSSLGGGLRIGPGPGGPGGPGEGRRQVGRLLIGSKPNLAEAQRLVGTLLAEEPDNREFRALQARCLLLEARLAGQESRGGRPPSDRPSGDRPLGDRPPSDRPDRERSRELAPQQSAAIDILRDLVQRYPGSAGLRFELCEALLGDQRREFDRGRRGDGPGREPANVTDAELERLREAKRHASQLVADAPGTHEYVAMLARTGAALSRACRDRADSSPDNERATWRRESEAELLAAVAAADTLVAAVPDPRYLRLLIDGRRALANLYFATDRRPLALVEAKAIVALVETQVRAAGSRGEPVAALLPFAGEGGLFARIETLLHGLGQEELLGRWRSLREHLPAGERGGPGGQPPDSRR